MGYASAGISNSPNYRLDVNTWLNGQDVGNNRSNVGWNLILVKLAGTGYNSNQNNVWRADIDGQQYSGTYTYNFGNYSQLVLANTSKDVGHAPDGSKRYGFFGYAEMSASRPGGGGSANPGAYENLPTIPRASNGGLTPTIHDVQPGAIQRLHTNRASTSFTHTFQYQFGNSPRTTIATGVGDWVDWNPPFSLLNQIPNDTTGVGTIYLTTYNGGTLIGETSFPFRVNVPSNVAPTFTDFTYSEANAAVTDKIGNIYVQGLSRLNYEIQGAQGIYGSSINRQEFILGGLTYNGQSGTTGAIGQSGTVTLIARVTDSRGRQFSRSKTFQVTPYSPPVISKYVAIRSDSQGQPDPDGEYLRVELTAAVTSLLVSGVQKNSLTYTTRTRRVGDAAWIQPIPPVVTNGITYNSWFIISPYEENKSWEVRVDVADKFNTSANQTTVSVAAVTMHWHEGGGLGIGRFWQDGGLDLEGDLYLTGQIVERGRKFGVLDPAYVGPGPARVKFYDTNTLSTEEYEWGERFEHWENRAVDLRNGKLFYDQRSDFGGPARLKLSGAWVDYSYTVGETTWNRAEYTKTPAGIVVLSGLVRGGSVATNSVIAVLPPGFRPDTDILFLINNSDNPRMVKVNPAGEITVHTDGAAWVAAPSYVALDGIAFPAAGVATWNEIGVGASTWANGWGPHPNTNWGKPRYWKDRYGHVWFAGVVSGGSTSGDNVSMFTVPTDHKSHADTHTPSGASGAWGFLSGRAGASDVAWKSGSNGGWVPLSRFHYSTQQEVDEQNWEDTRLNNGWVAYGGTFTSPAVVRREDGLALAKGLMRSGSLNSPAVALPERVWPRSRTIHVVASATKWGRVDVLARNDFGSSSLTRGQIQMSTQVDANWVSLDGMVWMTT